MGSPDDAPSQRACNVRRRLRDRTRQRAPPSGACQGVSAYNRVTEARRPATMPYLHFDLPARFPAATKRALAVKLGALYAEIMETSPDIVKVSFRELGAENLLRCGAPDGGVEPVVVGQCDIRRGRPVEQRAALAAAIVKACSEALGVDASTIELEFTQHAGDEMFRRGAFARDWTAAESDSIE